MERLTVRSHPKHSVPLVTAGGADVLLPNRRMLKRLSAITALALLLPLQTLAQSHSAFPIDISAGPAPRPVMADRSTRLVYELHLTNFSANPIELLALDVFGDDRSTPLASYQGEGLEKLLVAVGPTDSVGRVRAIGGGRSVVIFLDLTLPSRMQSPAALRHRFSLSISRKRDGSGGTIENMVHGPVVAVVQEAPPVFRSPLRGSGWIAFNSLGTETHRRALETVDGKARIAQRFAIDWVRLGADGCLFHVDPKSNANFYSYGAEVLAVADGRISDLKDGLPDNAGQNEENTRNITLDNIVGNYLTVDLGRGRFALYAHLQPGSLKVRLGDNVRTGQVLARLGNSGNSDEPHLHFQLMDANSPLASEGLPYELETFTQLGVIDRIEALDAGKPWQPRAGEVPIIHRHEIPFDDPVVIFP